MKSFPKHIEMREVDSSNKDLFGSSMDPHRVEIASYWHEHVLLLGMHLGICTKGQMNYELYYVFPLTDTLKGLGRIVRQNG